MPPLGRPGGRPEMHRFILAVLRRDLTLAARRRGDWLIAQFFFVMVASLFPLGVGPEPEMLARIGPGVLWVAATLASLLSLSRLFADDHHDGSLEHMVLSPEPTVLLVLGKSLAHWLIYCIPLQNDPKALGILFCGSGYGMDIAANRFKGIRAIVARTTGLHDAGVSGALLATAIPSNRLRRVDGVLTGDALWMAFAQAHSLTPNRRRRWFMENPMHEADVTWVCLRPVCRLTRRV